MQYYKFATKNNNDCRVINTVWNIPTHVQPYNFTSVKIDTILLDSLKRWKFMHTKGVGRL